MTAPRVRLGEVVKVQSIGTPFAVCDGFSGQLMQVFQRSGRVWGKVENGKLSTVVPANLLYPVEVHRA